MQRALVLALVLAALADATVQPWCRCPTSLNVFADVFTGAAPTLVTIRVGSQTFSNMSLLMNQAVVPLLPSVPLTGVFVTYQQKPVRCMSLVGGTLFTVRIDVPIMVGVLTYGGPRSYRVVLQLSAACLSTPTETFTIMPGGIIVELDTEDLAADPGQLLAPSSGALVTGNSATALLVCAPTGQLTSYRDCRNVGYSARAAPSRRATTVNQFRVCLAASSWTTTPDNSAARDATFVFTSGLTNGIVQRVCGRARISVFTGVRGAYGGLTAATPPVACHDSTTVLTNECSEEDVHLVYRTAPPIASNSTIEGMCILPRASDCRAPTQPAGPNWYIAAIMLGTLELMACVAMAALSIASSCTLKPAKRTMPSKSPVSNVAKPDTPQPLAAGGANIRFRATQDASTKQPSPPPKHRTGTASDPGSFRFDVSDIFSQPATVSKLKTPPTRVEPVEAPKPAPPRVEPVKVKAPEPPPPASVKATQLPTRAAPEPPPKPKAPEPPPPVSVKTTPLPTRAAPMVAPEPPPKPKVPEPPPKPKVSEPPPPVSAKTASLPTRAAPLPLPIRAEPTVPPKPAPPQTADRAESTTRGWAKTVAEPIRLRIETKHRVSEPLVSAGDSAKWNLSYTQSSQ